MLTPASKPRSFEDNAAVQHQPKIEKAQQKSRPSGSTCLRAAMQPLNAMITPIRRNPSVPSSDVTSSAPPAPHPSAPHHSFNHVLSACCGWWQEGVSRGVLGHGPLSQRAGGLPAAAAGPSSAGGRGRLLEHVAPWHARAPGLYLRAVQFRAKDNVCV